MMECWCVRRQNKKEKLIEILDFKGNLSAEGSFEAHLMVICSSASTRVGERPAANIASKRLRTQGSMAEPMAFAKFPTQAMASTEGLPLRGAIYESKDIVSW